MKLYEINENLRRVVNELDRYAEENGGEVNPNLERELNQVAIDRDIKIEHLVFIVRETRVKLEAIEQHKAYIEKQRKAMENRLDRLKEYLKCNLMENESRTGMFYWKTTESLQVNDISKVPEVYLTKEIRSKKEISLDLKNGAKIEGVEIVKNRSLVIK
jgi:hypothetical protein